MPPLPPAELPQKESTQQASKAAAQATTLLFALTAASGNAICLAEAFRAHQRQLELSGLLGAASLFAAALALCIGLTFSQRLQRFSPITPLFRGRLAPIGSSLLGLAFALFLVALVELSFLAMRITIHRPAIPQLGNVSAGNHVERDHFGYVGKPGEFHHTWLPAEGLAGFDALYTQNQFGRRVVPQDNPEQRDKHLLFFGCSYTFGTGCNDNETLPAQTATLMPEYHVYNMAEGGWGPAQVIS